MMKTKQRTPLSSRVLEFGLASDCTRGFHQGDVPEPMGFWPKTGISDR